MKGGCIGKYFIYLSYKKKMKMKQSSSMQEIAGSLRK